MDTDIPYVEDTSCTRAQCRCLCGGGACRLCCQCCPLVKESTSTRAVYIFFLLVSIAVMALMMSKEIQTLIMDQFSNQSMICEYVGAGEKCEAVLGYMAVYRLGLAITSYHILLMLLTYGVKRSKGCRAGVHNGLWFYKVMLMVGLSVAVFIIPDPEEYFIMSWMYIAMCGAGLFIVIQLVLLVFMVHRWADAIVRRVNDGGSPCCWYGVVVTGVTLASFGCCAGVTVLLYYYFAWDSKCHKNQWFIFINAGACVLVTIVSACKKGRTRLLLRLFQSSLIALYVQYLTWTALSSAPRSFRTHVATPITGGGQWSARFNSHSFYERYYCGPGRNEMGWTETVFPYVSVTIMFLTVVYASIGTAKPRACNALNFPDCPIEAKNNDEDTDGDAAAHVVEDIGGQKLVRNEKTRLAYSYPLFHIMLALATLFMMMSLTGWYAPTTASLDTFGRSWAAVWIKMASSWLCLLLYLFATLFPSLVPKRYERHLYISPDTSGHSLSRAGSYRSGLGNGNYSQNGSSRSIGRGFFGSNGSLGVAERLRRYSASQHSSLDAVPLSPSKQPPTIVCHQETTV